MKQLLSILSFVGCFSASLLAQTCAPIPTSYTLTVLPSLSGNFTVATSINSSGAVTGSSFVKNGSDHPFLWTAAGGFQDLGMLNGTDTHGVAINDQGTITGWVFLSKTSGLTETFLWTSSKGYQILPNLFHDQYAAGAPYAIDPNNRVVGANSNSYPDAIVASLWSGGKVYGLTSSSGDNTFAYATGVSDHMLVVGDDTASPEHAVAWSPSGGLIQLPNLPGTTLAAATGVNKGGTIVTGSNSPGVGIEAVAWVLDSLSGQYVLNDIGRGVAYAANDTCQVVGRISSGRAFIWTQSQGVVDLNTLIPPGSGVVLEYAYGTNNAGQIVGSTAIDNHGFEYGYVLTPVQ